jgi:peroxiredoxin
MFTRAALAVSALLVFVAAPLPAADTPPPAKLAAGVMAPDFSTFDLAGKEVRLADYRGKVLILDFWATWCAPCIASMPHTQELAAKYADQGVVVLAVCTGDKRGKFEDWVKLKASSYPAIRFTFDPHELGTPAHDRRASVALYGVPAIPAQFIIGRDGKIVATTDGYVTGDTRLEAALALAGVKVKGDAVARAAAIEKKLAAARAPAAPAGPKFVPPAFTEDAARLKAGTVMNELSLRTADGAETKISAYRGRPLVLCLSPAEMIPVEFLDRAVEKYSAQGVQVVSVVTRDSGDAYRGWLALHRDRFHFPVLLDPSGPDAVQESAVFKAVGMVVPMPLVVVLDGAGKLVGKVAPKVATSTRGLAELLRRTGVTVAAEDLPTPDMFPKPAAAAPAPAAIPLSAAPTVSAPTPAAAPESPADRDYAAFVALRSKQPPGKPREMGGMEKYFAWVDARALQVTADGLGFYKNYPQDPRRWDVVMTVINSAPIFMKGFAPKPGTKSESIADVIFDEPAKQAWAAQAETLKEAVLAAPDSQPEHRESIEFSRFAAESRRLRAQLKAGDAAAARASWLGLRDRFDVHVARYAGNERLAGEAGNFLTAWKDAVPGSLEEGCRHLLNAPDAGVRAFAAEKLKSLESLSRPLEIAFTAVDGRKVDLKDYRGKVVLVDFWATWCGPCIAELPNVKKVYADYHAQGFEVIGISLENAKLAPSDTPDQTAAKLDAAKKVLTDFTAANAMPWPQQFDGKFWKNEFSTRYGIAGIPAMFLVDQDGKIVTTNARGPKLEAEVKRLLKL